MQMVYIDRYSMVVDNNVCVTTKGLLGQKNPEVVPLETYVALLNKFNDRLEGEWNGLKTTMAMMGMK